MNRTKQLKNRINTYLDKPLTLSELAAIIGPRRGNEARNKSTHQMVCRWISKGMYGVKLESWVALTSRITTLRKYLTFRRQVAMARKQAARQLFRYLKAKRCRPSPRPECLPDRRPTRCGH